MGASLDTRYHELKATGELPSPTGVALALLELMQREDATVAEMTRLIQSDPALAGRLLKLVNAPGRAGGRRPVVAIPDAVQLLGTAVVRQVVLGLSVLSAYRHGRCAAFDYEHFWSHSLAIALALRELCAGERRLCTEEGFTCGLLAGVGRLALATVFPDAYAELLREAGGAPLPALLARERERFLTDHLELTGAMLADWGMPEPHRNAVAQQYGSAVDDGGRTAALTVRLQQARRFADVLAAGARCGEPVSIAPLVAATAHTGIGAPELERLFDAIAALWREWSHLLELPVPPALAFAELVAGADAAPPSAAAGGVHRLRVLVAEDEPATRDLLAAMLTASGCEVLTAADGRTALEAALSAQPHVVVTDRMMPRLDGLALCRALRDTRRGQRVYVIVLTARGDEQSLVEAFDAGADDYLVKPVAPRVLAARLRAGERLIRLQMEVEREQEETRRFLAELAVANRRLEQAALTDPLTGLPNRRYAMRRLRQAWAAARRAGGALACMLVDVDHFKAINDNHGHLAGDRALEAVARVLRASARADDEVCRIGGEEFLVLCASGDASAARAAAERLRDAVAAERLALPGGAGRLTVSVGVAVQSAADTDPDRLLRAADEAVYAAKAGGRNQVCLATTLQPVPKTRPENERAAQSMRGET